MENSIPPTYNQAIVDLPPPYVGHESIQTQIDAANKIGKWFLNCKYNPSYKYAREKHYNHMLDKEDIFWNFTMPNKHIVIKKKKGNRMGNLIKSIKLNFLKNKT